MKKAVQKYTACCLALGMTLAATGFSASADKVDPIDQLPPQVLAPVSEEETEDRNEQGDAQEKEQEASRENNQENEQEEIEDIDDGQLGSLEEAAARIEAEAEAARQAQREANEAALAGIPEEGTGDPANHSDEAEQAEESAGEAQPEEAAGGEQKEEAAGQEEPQRVEGQQTAKNEAVIDTSVKGTQGFAVCEEYVNVRSGAGVDYEPVGKLTNHDSVTLLAKVNDWYLIVSGNLGGYVREDYIAVGDEAAAIAEETAYHVAKVNAEALMIRTAPDENAESMGMAVSSEELEVVATEGDWMKVALGGDSYGYINANYVESATYYPTGETLQEEQERLDRQWLQYLAEQEAKRQAEEAAWLQYLAQQEAQQRAQEAAYAQYVAQQEAAYAQYMAQQQTATDQVTYLASADSSEQAAADAAYQTYLAAQAEADAATTGMDEQAVYDTAAAARQAYAEYLSAQSAADAAAVEAYSEAVYTEPAYTEASYTETTYAETGASGTQASADAAYQAYLDAQAAADEATGGMDEQAVYDTAAAAQEAYAEYLRLQYQADEEAVNGGGQTTDGSGSATYQEPAPQAQTTAPAETVDYSGYDLGDDVGYIDDSAYDDSSYVEPSYTVETPAQETTPSYSSTGSSIASFATQYVGNPYVYGGTSLTNGADCSGFVQSVFSNFGISLPRTAAEQSYGGTNVSMDNLQPGDLLFYNGGGGIGHVTIYMGDGQVVHASNPSNGITISDIGYRTPAFAKRYT